METEAYRRADGESPEFHKASRENKRLRVDLWLHIRAVALMCLHSHKDKINEKKSKRHIFRR